MNIITTLETARSCHNSINAKLDNIDKLHRILSRVNRKDNAERVLIKLNSLENEINTDIDELLDVKNDAYAMIKILPPNENAVIEHYYINGLDWETVAQKMNYSIRKIFTLRKNAIKQLKEIYGG